MKRPLLSVLFVLTIAMAGNAQCPTGYTQAQLNWDNLVFLSNGRANYSAYVTSAMASNQSFAFGTQKVSISNSYAAANSLGENTTNTGEAGAYGKGADIQFKGDGSVTFTFQNAVQNLKFSVFDIDYNQKVTVTASNSSSAQTVTMAKISGTVLTIAGSGTSSASATAAATAAVANTSTDGTINVDIPGPVTSFTLAIINTNTKNNTEDGSFWVSDIIACSSGSFPINYHQMPAAKPFTGQPDYFITTPDNNSAYMVDPATGKAWYLFTDTGATFLNSFAYDQVNHILYYVKDGTTSPSSNKQLKKYDFNTETSSVVISDLTTTLNIPTFNGGVESAGAAFYGGALYLGIEGGWDSPTSLSRKSIVWKIDFNSLQSPVSAAQVFATTAYSNSTTQIHDWGDFIVKDGKLYDFNTAQQGADPGPYTYSFSSFIHYDMMLDTVTNSYANSTSTKPYTGQVGMTWAGDLYAVRDSVEKYNLNGGKSGTTKITAVKGPVWVGKAGDASEPFKPKMDFGDAPATYDPSIGDPAVHEMDTALHLGAGIDREWVTTGQTALANTDNYDDGLPFTPILALNTKSYLAQVSVHNNTGAPATLIAWLDYNGNGLFDASEAIAPITIPSSTSNQSFNLFWPGISASLPSNSYTYLRVRLTSATNAMTAANATGYYNNGEVEDYRVLVNSSPLSVNLLSFDAKAVNNTAQLNWQIANEAACDEFKVERSADGKTWKTLAAINSTDAKSYTYIDQQPSGNKMYYRLLITQCNEKDLYSPVKSVQFEPGFLNINVYPNPANSLVNANIYSSKNSNAVMQVINMNGQMIFNKKIFLKEGNNTASITVSTIPNGFYIVQLKTEHSLIQKSIIIAKE